MDYIFDIDGTLLDISHRLKFITGPNEHYDTAKKDWKSFRDPKEKRWDEPIMEVINILIALKAAGNRVIILSGRCLLYTSPSPRDQRGSRKPACG